MIDRQGRKLIWAAAKAEGWTASKLGDFWSHGCPECGVQR